MDTAYSVVYVTIYINKTKKYLQTEITKLKSKKGEEGSELGIFFISIFKPPFIMQHSENHSLCSHF